MANVKKYVVYKDKKIDLNTTDKEEKKILEKLGYIKKEKSKK